MREVLGVLVATSLGESGAPTLEACRRGVEGFRTIAAICLNCKENS